MASEVTVATILGQDIKGRRPVATGADGAQLLEDNWTAIATVLTALAARTNRGITSGSGVPTTVSGAVVGDWYVNTATGDWYELGGSGWSLLMATAGVGISSISYASGTITITLTNSTTQTVPMPSVKVGSGNAGRPATPAEGDVYIDTSTWTLYDYASSTWTSRGTWQPGYTMADALTGDDYVDHTLDDTPGVDNSITLVDNTQYRLTSSGLTGIELKASSGLQIATMRAVSTGTPYEWYVPTSWVCIGDSCDGGVHVPAASTRYQYTVVYTGDTVQPYTVYCTQIPYIVE